MSSENKESEYPLEDFKARVSALKEEGESQLLSALIWLVLGVISIVHLLKYSGGVLVLLGFVIFFCGIMYRKSKYNGAEKLLESAILSGVVKELEEQVNNDNET